MSYGGRVNLTDQQVMGLAPDAASAGNGRKLAAPAHWQGLGRSEHALWGECKGSAVYQVRVSTADWASKCTCPSRKFPCKHALGLMFLAARADSPLAEAPEPTWVAEWLGKRDSAVKAKETRAAAPVAPPDPAKQAARAAKREARVADGVAALDRWLGDVARGGLAGLEQRPASFFEDVAARLVDAQAPGLAGRVRRLATIPHEGPGWPGRMLGQLGRAALLTEAFGRLDALDPALAEDVRLLVGWSLTEAEVLARGDRAADAWHVLGRAVDAEPAGGNRTILARRTWLRGERSGRLALLLDFDAVGAGKAGGGFGPGPSPGVVLEGELAFWPGGLPLRATPVGAPALRAAQGPPPGRADLATLLADVAAALGRQPWLERLPAVVADARVAIAADDAWQVLDAAGRALPLRGAGRWRLLALGGGHPVDLAGEWDGTAFRPLTAWVDGTAQALEGEG